MLLISEKLKTAYPGGLIGAVLIKNASNSEFNTRLEKKKEELENDLRTKYENINRSDLSLTEPVRTYVNYYKRFKKTYHVLLQLESIILKKKSIPNVAPLVETMFMAELKNLLLTAGHDMDAVKLPIRVDLSRGNERYILLNGQEKGSYQSATVEKEYEEVHILPLHITPDDQKEVEELIYDYFNALEHKDYLNAWELMSTKYKSKYKDFNAYQNTQQNSNIESIKLTGIKGYIPPYKTEEFITAEVPEGVPTIWFEAYFELKLSRDDPIWVNGENERFVIVEKEDGVWKIGGLASSP